MPCSIASSVSATQRDECSILPVTMRARFTERTFEFCYNAE